MKWLITGGCGFLGSNIADLLLSKGDEVTIFDNLSRVGTELNLAWLRQRHGQEWRFVEGDIREAEIVSGLVQKVRPEAIAHLAGQVAMTTSLQNPRLDFEINALGSVNLLEASRHHAPEAVVLYSSTNKVYGDLEWVSYLEGATRYIAPEYLNGFNENTPLDFHSPYGCSKGAADQYMLDYARMFGLQTVVFRHSSMYGGRQFATYDQGWIGWFCQQALNIRHQHLERPFTISGNGKQVRDVLHVDDIKFLYLRAIEHIDQARGQAFNVGGGMENSLSLLELFELLETKLNVQMSYEQLPSRASDQKVFVADITKAKTLLNWQPKVSAQNGIMQMLEWLEDLDSSGTRTSS